MGPAKSIAKPSKVSANISRGEQQEIASSLRCHAEGMPVLVSALVLRQRDLGQCDLVRFFPQRRVVEIWEVKRQSRPVLSWGQRERLRRSGHFLAKILGASVLLRVIGRD